MNLALKTAFLIFFIQLYVNSFKTDVSEDLRSSDKTITEIISSWQKSPDFNGASWGFSCYNITTKKEICSYNQFARLNPASVLKLITTATAFDLLKPDYKIPTVFGYTGQIDKSGVLLGDIIVKGYGDPTTDNSYFGDSASTEKIFGNFIKLLKKQNIHKIQGNIVADASTFGIMFQAPGYLWEDIGNHYGAGVSALNFKENKLSITFKQESTEGKAVTIKSFEPHPDSIMYINTVTTGKKNSGDNAYVFGSPFQKERILNGTIPPGNGEYTIYGANPNPPKSFISLLYNSLQNNGIEITGTPKVIFSEQDLPNSKITELYKFESPPLSTIATLINQKSHNISAEAVFRIIGLTLKKDASYTSSSEAIYELLKNKGIDVSAFSMFDGSGLSRKNMLTSDFLCKMLIYITQQSYFGEYYNTLSVAGKTGTLKNYCIGTVAENNVRGKTGFMEGIRSIAGYATNSKGEQVCFALLINNHTMSVQNLKSKIEELLIAICRS